jgi:phosphohistidine phosphatase
LLGANEFSKIKSNMKTIILMRHSHAIADNPAFSDHERPLTANGKALASSTAELLANLATPSRILCSSATRTQETAEIVAAKMARCAQPESFDALYLASAGGYLNVAAEHLTGSDDTVLVVGHNPGIASLIATWADDHLRVPPATAAIFLVDIDNWQSLTIAGKFIPELSGLITEGCRVH